MLATTLVLTTALGAPDIAPDAQPVLDRMFNYYKGLAGASATMSVRLPFPGAPEQKTTYSAIKPNKFKVVADLSMMDAGKVTMVSNGTHMWTVSEKEKVWSEDDAPKSFDALGQEALGGMSGPVDTFFDLLTPDPAKSMLGDMKTVTFGGTKSIDDVTYDIVSMTPDPAKSMMLPEGVTIDLAITRGKTPWLHNATLTFVDPAGNQPPMTVTLKMGDWKVVKAGSEQFAFAPADDDKKVGDVFEELFAGGPDVPPEEQFEKMTGKPAPEFSLKDIDGNTVTLASLRGKTVILDFFATWCGPCKMGMPVLMDIAKARADDGVVLYVIDLDEPVDKLKEFLANKKWDLNMLMSGDSKVAQAYKVGGIPHTVVIGPKGNIHLIEVGFMGKEHTEKVINGAIDAALGKTVASAE